MSEMRQAVSAAQRELRGICLLLGLSEMQVCEAEPDRGAQVSEVRRRGHCGAQGADREYLLGLHAVSEMQLHFESEAGGAEVPAVRFFVCGGARGGRGTLPDM